MLRRVPIHRVFVVATVLVAASSGMAEPGGADEPEQRYVVIAVEPDEAAIHTPGGSVVVQTPSASVVETIDDLTGSGSIVSSFDAIDGAVVELTAAEAAVLALDSDLIVEPDLPVSIDEVPWGLDRIDQQSSELDGRFAARMTGAGVPVFVVDTGVKADHGEFGHRVVPGLDLFDDQADATTDCHGHGTHVASVVAGRTLGVAPAATIVPVRVLDCEGAGHTSGVARAIDWIVAEHEAPGVVNLSIGGSRSEVLDAAISRAHSAGFVVVVAAGNDSGDACATSPARAPEAITVGAVGRSDVYARWSNKGPCVDIAAPGLGIEGANARTTDGTRNMSGTSQAAPHVAGVAALLIESGVRLPDQVLGALLESASTGALAVESPAATVSQYLVLVLPEAVRLHVEEVEVMVLEGPAPAIVVTIRADGPVGVQLASRFWVESLTAVPNEGVAMVVFSTHEGTHVVKVAESGTELTVEVGEFDPPEALRLEGEPFGLDGLDLLLTSPAGGMGDLGRTFGPTGVEVMVGPRNPRSAE
ncbi:MAG: S8 family peptidase [Actinomycetia bacterium]|nr:S8 family peptidase [Actinomycetes bacterium]